MIEFAATLYAIETLVGWALGIIAFAVIGVIVYSNAKFERERDRKRKQHE